LLVLGVVAALLGCSSKDATTGSGSGKDAGMTGAGGSGTGAGGSGGTRADGGSDRGGTTGTGGSIGDAMPPPNNPAFPIKVSANKRYLVDQQGKPFLMAGNSAQGLMVNLAEADADSYFASLAAVGVNTVWVNLLVDMYTGGRANGTTSDGIAPFTTANDLSTPNEAYFAHADNMLKAAARHNIVVLLDPIETGGWLTVLKSAGVTTARAYGRYVGGRYAGYGNIIWLNGNDLQTWQMSGDDAVVKAVSDGIRDMDTSHIQTIELDYYASDSVEDPTWSGSVELNSCYSYYSIYDQLYADYKRATPIPSVMIESNYEGEMPAHTPHVTNAHDVRAQYYWSDLSGASGQVYGNGTLNHFKSGWQDHLNDPGLGQTVYLQNLLVPRAWQDLVPDMNNTVVTAGFGTYTASSAMMSNMDDTYAPTARTADGKLVITYMPQARMVTVDMTKLSGAATARWYDPTNGAFTAISGSPFANTGSHMFTPPSGTHADGYSDWVLLLETN
jgi:hypothetical protein